MATRTGDVFLNLTRAKSQHHDKRGRENSTETNVKLEHEHMFSFHSLTLITVVSVNVWTG